MLYQNQLPVASTGMGGIQGLPHQLSSTTLTALHNLGRSLSIVEEDRLTTYSIIMQECGLVAQEQSRCKLPGEARAVAESSLGLIICVSRKEHALLLLITEHEPIPILEVRGNAIAMVISGVIAYLTVQQYNGGGTYILKVNLRQREIATSLPLDHEHVILAIDTTGEHLLLTDIVNRRITGIDSSLRPKTINPQFFSRTPQSKKGHEHNCCCISCMPTGREVPHDPATTNPADEIPNDDESDDEPTNDHHGQTGIPTPDGGTIVGNGGQVTHHPPGRKGSSPCGRRLFYEVTTLQKVGGYILASDRSARHVSLLSADMNLVDEWHFGRGGAMLISSEQAPTMLMHLPGSGKWLWHDVYKVADTRRIDLKDYLPARIETKTFIGQKTYAMSYGQQQSPTEIKAILLPVIEGDQTYSSADLAGFGAYMNRTMVPQIKDYYDENSFGFLKNANVSVFGVNVGPKAGPLKLPRKKLADYFFPEYIAAAAILTKNSISATAQIILDGRETMQVEVKTLTGGPAGGTLTFPFFALGFQRDEVNFPVSIKFLGTETLTIMVKMPAGDSKTLNLSFPVKTIAINDSSQITAGLSDLVGYLDAIMKAAETGAGIGSRLFTTPKATVIKQIGSEFGRLLVTFNAATTTGNKLQITSIVDSTPGGDPMGLSDPMRGTMNVSSTWRINEYMENITLMAQEAAGFGYNDRRLNPPVSNWDGTTSKLTITIPVSDRYGGPGAEVKLLSSLGLETLFDAGSARPNSATTNNSATALRDRSELYQDVFSAAIERLRVSGMPTDALKGFGAVLIMPVEPATPDPANPLAVLPSELWNVGGLHRPFGFRGAENVTTVIDSKDKTIQLSSAWALIFMTGGLPDIPLIVHELGHALGMGDLYHQHGYRDELRYMGDWAMMDNHPPMTHHCGYHKLQMSWIPDGAGTETDFGRVFPLGLPDASAVRTWEFLLVPIELWRDSLINSSRAAFGVGANFPVAQLGYIDFGGDGSTFGLIEARQRGARFSHALPGPAQGILITNGISWRIDERYATNTWYRRPLQLLNPDNILQNAGDRFDLARAAELPVKGMTVEVLDRKVVEGDATVYRVKVSRENAEFIDLYFDRGDPYYRSPDHWVDWVGNNDGNPEQLNPNFGLGQPIDQGEAIRVPDKHTEKHWLVARVRNRGQVKAVDVKLNYFYFDPPGAGDSGKPMDPSQLGHYKLVGSKTVPEILGGNAPQNVLLGWDVPAGFSGHTCLLVQIEDYKIPRDSTGAALGSEDMWQLNNHCQKNVDTYQALSASPFAPVEFDFSVLNAGVRPEIAYPEPDGLPYGMKLTVSPSRQLIPVGKKAIFHCKLELDEKIIRTGCENDQRFRIIAWREDPESSARWGGVEYEIQPREKTVTTLTGYWDAANEISLKGTIALNPGGGLVQIRLDFQNQQPRWVAVNSLADGSFTWVGKAPANSFELESMARFEGNKKFGKSRSNTIKLNPPPIIR